MTRGTYRSLHDSSSDGRRLTGRGVPSGLAVASWPVAPAPRWRPRVRAAVLTVAVVLLAPASSGAQPLSEANAQQFTAGVAALKAGQLDTAERAFRDVLQAGGELAFVHHNLGLVLRERHRLLDALAEFRAATRLDPTFGPAWLFAGITSLALDRPAAAVTDLERATALLPDQTIVWRTLADAYQRTGNLAGVVATWRRLAATQPPDPEAVYRLGRAYLAQAQWAHEQLRRLHPSSARVSQALGREYLQQGRPEQALAAFGEAARRAPTLPEIHLAIATILLEQGQVDAAAREIEAELAISPRSADALALKAKVEAARRK